MIVKFQNVGVENKTVLFYGVEDVNDSCCLRICVEELLKDKKNLKKRNYRYMALPPTMEVCTDT